MEHIIASLVLLEKGLWHGPRGKRRQVAAVEDFAACRIYLNQDKVIPKRLAFLRNRSRDVVARRRNDPISVVRRIAKRWLPYPVRSYIDDIV